MIASNSLSLLPHMALSCANYSNSMSSLPHMA